MCSLTHTGPRFIIKISAYAIHQTAIMSFLEWFVPLIIIQYTLAILMVTLHSSILKLSKPVISFLSNQIGVYALILHKK